MSIVKKAQDVFGPWSDFFDVERFFGNDWMVKTKSVPSVNIKENDNSFSIELSAAGMKKDDFKINVEDGVITISAEKKEEKSEKDEKYTRKEFSYSSFSRSFNLPENADGDKASAGYENGMLTINLPKKVAQGVKKGREISIT